MFAVVPLKSTVVSVPSQFTTLAGSLTFGVGSTVIVNDCAAPTQVLGAVGVTFFVPVTGEAVVFVATKLGVDAVPEAAKPIEGVEFVQANVVPATEEVNVCAGIVVPVISTMFAGTVTTGVGFTFTVMLCGVAQISVGSETVYVVVVAGEAITLTPDAVFKPVEGVQV